MNLVHTTDELRQLRRDGSSTRPLVLVPTMGSLHAGHLSLVEHGLGLGDVVVSIFVNPTQFGPGEDYDAYPRDLEADLALLAPLAPEAVFAPSRRVMYPREGGVSVRSGPAAGPLCGANRAGHFDGVLTVVLKLLNLVQPDVAIFGRKDAQQCLVIAEMVADLAVPVRLIDAPTVRESDGLAMSSRNVYLSASERQQALALSRSLQAVRKRLEEGERAVQALVRGMHDDLAAVDSIDYAEVRRLPDLAIPDRAAGRLLVAVAARVGATRLIDNLVLEVGSNNVRETSLIEQGVATS